jgi:hypothetical protein
MRAGTTKAPSAWNGGSRVVGNRMLQLNKREMPPRKPTTKKGTPAREEADKREERRQ